MTVIKIYLFLNKIDIQTSFNNSIVDNSGVWYLSKNNCYVTCTDNIGGIIVHR
jgi:hypothetical protein